MWRKEEIDESGCVTEPSYFLLFSVSCLTTSQRRRVQGLVFEDDRCAADVIKVSWPGNSVACNMKSRVHLYVCWIARHLIEKAILKTMCVEILVVPWFYSSYCKSLILLLTGVAGNWNMQLLIKGVYFCITKVVFVLLPFLEEIWTDACCILCCCLCCLCIVFVSYFVFFKFVALWWPRAINFMAESQRWNLSLTSLTAGV